uniref:Putative secreted protein n=1 Tax=Anopheles darlingi TaxID=43151 RepID=A0A2M4D9X8_ANODA
MNFFTLSFLLLMVFKTPSNFTFSLYLVLTENFIQSLNHEEDTVRLVIQIEANIRYEALRSRPQSFVMFSIKLNI